MNKIYYIIMLVFVGMLVIAGYIFFVDDENEVNTNLVVNANDKINTNIVNSNLFEASDIITN